jgi:hypothetical protein
VLLFIGLVAVAGVDDDVNCPKPIEVGVVG